MIFSPNKPEPIDLRGTAAMSKAELRKVAATTRTRIEAEKARRQAALAKCQPKVNRPSLEYIHQELGSQAPL